MSVLDEARKALASCDSIARHGRVRSLRGLCVEVADLRAPLGALVSIESGQRATPAEVIGFDAGHAIVMPLGAMEGIGPGAEVVLEQIRPTIPVGEGQLGRVVDAMGRAIDDRGAIHATGRRPIDAPQTSPLRRRLIRQALPTGVRAVDCLTPIGRGQRMGIFAGPGVGKSTLLAQLARGSSSDANVIALIGERGREVGEFVHETLGDRALEKSVVVASTGDESPAMRVRAAKSACAIAEHLRDRGLDVLLIMDSATRFAHAQRQIGLAVGEMPATRGYTPSVFSELARLLERAGAIAHDERSGTPAGSITGLYTILVEGDDLTEPVADAARGILDGHLILSRELAQRGHYPAIDVLDSVSRVASEIAPPEHLAARQTVLRLLSAHREIEELVRIGAYARGSDPHADVALDLLSDLRALLTQTRTETPTMDQSVKRLIALAERADAAISAKAALPAQSAVSANAGRTGAA